MSAMSRIACYSSSDDSEDSDVQILDQDQEQVQFLTLLCRHNMKV
jgi:hypothetical protein